MATLTSIIPDILVEIPEVPQFVAKRQLLRATREFAERTRAWRRNIQISVIANTATVNLQPEFGTTSELVDIITIKNTGGGAPLTPTTFVWLDENMSDWRSDTAVDAQYYVLESNNTIRLVPYPSTTTANLYDVRVCLKPIVATATTIPDVLANKFDEVLVHGALGRLYSIPRKPWTDANLAQYHMALFMDGVFRGEQEAVDEFQTGVPRKIRYGGL